MTRTRIVIAVAALAMAALTARLGIWQLDRAAQKEALQRALDAERTAPPVGLAELARGAAPVHRAIRLRGTWLSRHTVYLDNRPMAGRVGFVVVTPLRLEDGSAIAVQRGWLPRDAGDRTRIAPYRTPEGVVDLVGRVAPAPSRLMELGTDATGPIRQNLDLGAYGTETGQRLHPVTVLQQDEPAHAGDGLSRQWPTTAPDAHKNYGYAVQWFGLSTLIVALYVWFQLVRPRRRPAP